MLRKTILGLLVLAPVAWGERAYFHCTILTPHLECSTRGEKLDLFFSDSGEDRATLSFRRAGNPVYCYGKRDFWEETGPGELEVYSGDSDKTIASCLKAYDLP